jgi:glycosyltransferase involved in cell wall biosynthesis
MLVDDQPHDLARAILTIFREHEFRSHCSRAARKYAEEILRPERYVKKVRSCYESIGVNDRPSSGKM